MDPYPENARPERSARVGQYLLPAYISGWRISSTTGESIVNSALRRTWVSESPDDVRVSRHR